jgi:large subunit ribosomal protein L17e
MHTIQGMQLSKAKSFLKDVTDYKQAVPFTMFTGGVGRHAQLKQVKAPGSKGRWPIKAAKVIMDLLENAEANAESNGLETDNLVVKHAMANRAPKTRRRT